MPKKLTFEFVKSEFEKRGYELLEDNYYGSEVKMKYRCGQHPDRFVSIRYNDLRNGVGCPYCKSDKQSAERKIPLEVVESEFKTAGYTLLDKEYKGNKQRLRYECPNHPEKELRISYIDLKRGVRCPYCSKVGKPTIEQIRQEFYDRGYILLENMYINSVTKLHFFCPNHPEANLSVSYSNFKFHGHGCRICAGKNSYSFKEVKDSFSDRGYTLLETEYKDNSTKMQFLCDKHPDKDTFIAYKEFLKGRGCRYCSIEYYTGENHPNWNPDLSNEEREVKRFYPDYYKWRKLVFERDSYTCRTCGDITGGNLNAHHLDGYNWCIEKRTDVSNGITLCDSCHESFHNKYGYGDNTKEQFDRFIAEVSR